MKFDLVRPCPHCPFRTDIEPFLRLERARELRNDLLCEQRSFTCHETVDYDDDDDDHEPNGDGPDAQHCAGALIVLEHMARPNQIMRWMERLHAYDRTNLDMGAPVYKNLDAWVAAHQRKENVR